MARKRLLTDTCSVFMLLACGSKIFSPGILKRGDLVIHPQVWTETRRWPKRTKSKYRDEYALLHGSLNATTVPRLAGPRLDSILEVVKTAEAAMSISVGRSDSVQLAVVLEYDDIDLVTNDSPLQQLAEALEREVFNAEQILVEALREGVLTQKKAQSVLDRWKRNGESIKQKNKATIKRNRLRL